ncbi:hypothetical protein cypCar_00044607, partial [Cyprinus carpio]
ESLWSVYSAFGALYLLKVCPSATVAEPGFYALVKFYSSDPEEKLRKRGTLMKRAKDKAVVAAFEKVLLMILGNGKVAIEIKYNPDEILPEENKK